MSEEITVGGKGKLQVTVHQLQDVPSHHPFVRVSVGRQSFRTKTLPNAKGVWDQTFTFNCRFHAHLFFSLNVEVLDTRKLLGDLSTRSLGRTKLSIAGTSTFTTPTTSTYKLLPNYLSTMNYESKKNSSMEQVAGGITLTILYTDENQNENVVSLKKGTQESFQRNSAVGGPIPLQGKELGFSDVWSDETAEFPVRKHDEQSDQSSEIVDLVHDNSEPNEPNEPNGPNEPKESNHFEKNNDQLEDQALEANSPSSTPEGFFTKIQSSISETTVKVFTDISTKEERQAAWLTFYEMLASWTENLGVAEGLLGLKLLETYYESRKKPVIRDVATIPMAKDAIHYFQYTIAVLGWKGLAYCKKLSKSEAFRIGDERAIEKFLTLQPQFKIKFYLKQKEGFQPCHIVFYEEKAKEIIVAVRGTMSINDALVDGVCEYAPWGDGFVHKGIAWATNWLVNSILPDIVRFAQEHEVLRIVSTGHSLGGAVSTLFSITMKEHISTLSPDHPLARVQIVCHSYGGPPIVSSSLCKDYNDFVFNYINNDDIVPLLSYGGLMDCRSMILMALDQHSGNTQRVKQIVGSTKWVPNFVKSVMNAPNDKELDLIELTPEQKALHPKLYLPGMIYRLRYFDKNEGLKRHRHYATEQLDRTEITEVAITPGMLKDHLPDAYEESLNAMMKCAMAK